MKDVRPKRGKDVSVRTSGGKIMHQHTKCDVTTFTFSDGMIVDIIARGSPPPGVDLWQWYVLHAETIKTIVAGKDCVYLTQQGIDAIRRELAPFGHTATTFDEFADDLSAYHKLPRSAFYSGKPYVIRGVPIWAVRFPRYMYIHRGNRPVDDVFDRNGKVKP